MLGGLFWIVRGKGSTLMLKWPLAFSLLLGLLLEVTGSLQKFSRLPGPKAVPQQGSNKWLQESEGIRPDWWRADRDGILRRPGPCGDPSPQPTFL